jgi:hypothetical protein
MIEPVTKVSLSLSFQARGQRSQPPSARPLMRRRSWPHAGMGSRPDSHRPELRRT